MLFVSKQTLKLLIISEVQGVREMSEQKAERNGEVTVFEPVKMPERQRRGNNKWRSWLKVTQGQGLR